MDDALARLEQRLQRVEDELAVLRLLTSYGPLADAGSTGAAELWSEDGEYDVDGWRIVHRISRPLDGSAATRQVLTDSDN